MTLSKPSLESNITPTPRSSDSFSTVPPIVKRGVVLVLVSFYCVVREVNVGVFGKGLELLSANGGRFEINQLLFADDTALVADSEEKLGRLVSEFVEYAKEES